MDKQFKQRVLTLDLFGKNTPETYRSKISPPEGLLFGTGGTVRLQREKRLFFLGGYIFVFLRRDRTRASAYRVNYPQQLSHFDVSNDVSTPSPLALNGYTEYQAVFHVSLSPLLIATW